MKFYLSTRWDPVDQSTDVRAFLNTSFPKLWIVHDGRIVCPATSSDLTPLDFFLLGLLQRQSLFEGHP